MQQFNALNFPVGWVSSNKQLILGGLTSKLKYVFPDNMAAQVRGKKDGAFVS